MFCISILANRPRYLCRTKTVNERGGDRSPPLSLPKTILFVQFAMFFRCFLCLPSQHVKQPKQNRDRTSDADNHCPEHHILIHRSLSLLKPAQIALCGDKVYLAATGASG